MGPGQHIQAHGIPSGGMSGSLSIQIRTHLWISWARIALKHETAAHTARDEMQQPGAKQSQLLEREADAGLDGICAAAFALEALSRELVDLGVVQQANITAWTNKGLSAEKILVEVLKARRRPARTRRHLAAGTGVAVHRPGELRPLPERIPAAPAPPARDERCAHPGHLHGREHRQGRRSAARHLEAMPRQAHR